MLAFTKEGNEQLNLFALYSHVKVQFKKRNKTTKKPKQNPNSLENYNFLAFTSGSIFVKTLLL